MSLFNYFSICETYCTLSACILGHSNINTTRVYTHTSGAEYRRQMEKLALLL